MHIVKKKRKRLLDRSTKRDKQLQATYTSPKIWVVYLKKKKKTSEEKTVTVTRNTKNERVDTFSRKLICSEESTLGEVVRLKKVRLISGESGSFLQHRK